MNTTVNPKLNDLKQELVASLIEKEIINLLVLLCFTQLALNSTILIEGFTLFTGYVAGLTN